MSVFLDSPDDWPTPHELRDRLLEVADGGRIGIVADPKVSMDVIKEATEALYSMPSIGCCLHVLVDDGNIDDRTVNHCRGWAGALRHDDCGLLARAYGALSVSQRAGVLGMVICPKCHDQWTMEDGRATSCADCDHRERLAAKQ